MVLTFATKIEVVSFSIDSKGQFLALELADGTGEIHAIFLETDPFKVPSAHKIAFCDIKEKIRLKYFSKIDNNL